ncbi:hypothetical protein Tco_0953695 [Tanacetum coccineum]|uniref:Uncharacterized protein n=1 Tax=Tanacetum coccineum TaxID=301880 RepID=A0ABQ5E0P6_9ASTR
MARTLENPDGYAPVDLKLKSGCKYVVANTVLYGHYKVTYGQDDVKIDVDHMSLGKNGLIVYGIDVHTLIVLFYVVVLSVYSWDIDVVWCKCSEFKESRVTSLSYKGRCLGKDCVWRSEPRGPWIRLTGNLGLDDRDHDGSKWASTWMAFGGNTRDLSSFEEETDEITDFYQIHEEISFLKHGDDVASIKRRRRDPSSDDVRDLVTASEI